MSVAQETYVSSGAAQLWTANQGDGQAIMLCSGGPGYPDYLAPVAGMLDDLGQVIRFEQRGCGRTQAVPPFTLADCLADLEAIRQHYGAERWIIGGHSWGADLALAYALAYPGRVRGLLCLAGGRTFTDINWMEEFRRRKGTEGEPLPQTEIPPNVEVYQQVVRDWSAAMQRPTLLRDLAQVDVPALFLYGERDPRPGWQVAQIAHLLPHARYVTIPDAPHMLWFTHAEDVARELRTFVADIPL